ncbi:L-threonylcarbamoyladenylate synthase [Sulfoacidibacillus ferrooxidans]|uniref:Threonylcarbamoyl-AMP synthase n=1 Tax=Sulfoacidibacillus ferrooxidans TaxID=2005001 RepID=A0A9X2ADF5_9BACL|nr:Threonylcarbamoyl-AMP synthase [Sulfoacidibacillus ferrooxidans]
METDNGKQTILWQLATRRLVANTESDPRQQGSVSKEVERVIVRTLPLEELVRDAAQYLQRDELVAFPTETVYGLGANALSSKALQRVFAAKQRPLDNPLIAHISALTQLDDLTETVSPRILEIMKTFWPGPLSILLPARKELPHELTAGLPTVAVRMPNHALTLALIEAAGVPVAGPSANVSGRPSPTNAYHVLEDLSGKIAGIVDGGACSVGIESTVIEVSEKEIVILRPGAITPKDLARFGLSVRYDEHLIAQREVEVQPRSPGQKYRHYAPRGELRVISGRESRVIDYIQDEIEMAHEKGLRIALIGFEPHIGQLADCRYSFHSEVSGMAVHLYDALRTCDAQEIDVILAQGFDQSEAYFAVMNRLFKASGGTVITLT